MVDKTTPKTVLRLPALRGRMGDWTYYVAVVPMPEIAKRVTFAEDLIPFASLREQIQRQLTKNAAKIAEYLMQETQRLFNALVVGSFEGSPSWYEISISESELAIPFEQQGILGLLELSGEETLFAIDGQHRVAGIQEALRRQEEISLDEVCVIFVKGILSIGRENDPEGYQRTRRLFTTLNRYANPVKARDLVALDEDDVVAIVTRRLIDSNPLFVGKAGDYKQKNLPASDREHFTSIVALHDAMAKVLRRDAKPAQWKNYRRFRPPEGEVDAYFRVATGFWRFMCGAFPDLAKYRDLPAGENAAAEFRNLSGGNLLFRPAGLLVVAEVVSRLIVQGFKLGDAVKRVAGVPVELSAEPWKGLLWDDRNHRMLTANSKLAWWLLYFAVGGDMNEVTFSANDLREELAAIKQVEPRDVRLPKYDGAT